MVLLTARLQRYLNKHRILLPFHSDAHLKSTIFRCSLDHLIYIHCQGRRKQYKSGWGAHRLRGTLAVFLEVGLGIYFGGLSNSGKGVGGMLPQEILKLRSEIAENVYFLFNSVFAKFSRRATKL